MGASPSRAPSTPVHIETLDTGPRRTASLDPGELKERDMASKDKGSKAAKKPPKQSLKEKRKAKKSKKGS
jgi:hypothetical protein